jgi:hypothetical protein
MAGFTTRSLPMLEARHHRAVATRGGALRGRARHGECAYILRYGLPWVLARSFKVATQKPFVLSGLAFLYGYLRAKVKSQPKVEDEQFKRFVRRELRTRLSVFQPMRADLFRSSSRLLGEDPHDQATPARKTVSRTKK